MSNSTNTYPLFGSVGYVLVSAPGAVANFLIAASIARYAALRDRKEMVMLMGLALADAINLTAICLTGFHRLYIMATDRASTKVPSINCALSPGILLFSMGTPISRLLLVGLSLDRLLLVVLRARYMVFAYRKYLLIMVGVPFVLSVSFGLVACLAAAFAGHQEPKVGALCYVPACLWSDSVIFTLYKPWYVWIQTICPMLSVVVFAALIPVYKHFANQAAPGNQTDEVQLKRQKKLTITIGISVACTFLLSVAPSRVAYNLWYVQKNYLLSWCFYFVLMCNPHANFFIYHIGHRDMRTALVSMLQCKDLPTNLQLWPGNN